MALETLLAFTISVLLLVLVPGPVIVLVSTLGAARGVGAAVSATLGASASIAAQLSLAGLSLLSILEIAPRWLVAIQVVAGLYIAYVGLRLLRATEEPKSQASSAAGPFVTGFMISSVNPKSILFFGAIFPQFLDPASPSLPQILTMCLIFQAIFTTGVLAYACFGAWLGARLSQVSARPWATKALGLGLLVFGLGFGVLPRLIP